MGKKTCFQSTLPVKIKLNLRKNDFFQFKIFKGCKVKLQRFKRILMAQQVDLNPLEKCRKQNKIKVCFCHDQLRN